MKIAYITSGAAGMFCGSCMKDNTLAVALNRLGHDALLIPTYTPIRTDEEDISQHRVFFGGINVYLQQKSWLFRHTPWLLDRLLDFPRLLRWVSRFAIRTRADRLGGLTISVLQGDHGKQRKEVQKLVEWLATDFQPDAVILSNVLISGLVPALKEKLNVPVLGTLQGDDIFLEALPADDRARSIELIRRNGEHLSGYLATSHYYADFMAGYLGLPREQIHVVYPGLNLKGHGGPREFRNRPPYTIGFFARICPEKGLHNLIDAFVILRKALLPCRLRISGWLGKQHRPYFDEQMRKLKSAGLDADVEHVDCPTHEDKVRFFQSLDVLSVPTVYREPKGIYILEALANGVPVVQPRHGSFPELIEATGGGHLVDSDNPLALADGIKQLLEDVPRRRQLGEQGKQTVHARFAADNMARETASILAQYHAQSSRTNSGGRADVNQPFRTTRRIEFGDTDMAGIAHFSNFFRFMESAETAFLRTLGLTVSWREGEQKLGFPRVSAACDYKRPVRFEDVLDIAVTVEEVGRKSVRYRFDFSRNGEEIAVGRITSVFCRSTPDHGIESIEIPSEVRAKLGGN